MPGFNNVEGRCIGSGSSGIGSANVPTGPGYNPNILPSPSPEEVAQINSYVPNPQPTPEPTPAP